jgi:CRP/FNR family cyclic AMP-dependent transcriptional regulator
VANASRLFLGFQVDESEFRSLSALGKAKTYPKKNTVIVQEGDNTDTFFLLTSGRVKVYVSDDEGREVVLRTVNPGEYFGEMSLDGHPRSASIVTLERTCVIAISRSKFRDYVDSHQQFAIRLIEHLIGRLRTMTEDVKSLALMDVYGRVARLLLDMAKVENGRQMIPEKLTQQDIASRVGASSDMISKVLKELEARGYISRDRKRITINGQLPPSLKKERKGKAREDKGSSAGAVRVIRGRASS